MFVAAITHAFKSFTHYIPLYNTQCGVTECADVLSVKKQVYTSSIGAEWLTDRDFPCEVGTPCPRQQPVHVHTAGNHLGAMHGASRG